VKHEIAKQKQTRKINQFRKIMIKKIFLLLTVLSGTMFAEAQTATSDEGVVINGVKWATRNLVTHGTFVTNPEDYGSLFQWGRIGDGHEQRTSNTTTNYSETSTPGHPNFILTTEFTQYDWFWAGSNTLWNSGTESAPVKTANDPCPAGWRVPTYSEFASLRNAAGTGETINGIHGRVFGNDNNTIFVPIAGYRACGDGYINPYMTYGYYWSSTTTGNYNRLSYYFQFHSTWVAPTYEDNVDYRSFGFCVRCVAEHTAPYITTVTLPIGGVGITYSTTLAFTGSSYPVALDIENGDLPNGLTLSENGVIFGTPTIAGTFNFIVKATNSLGFSTKGLSITIMNPPVIITDTLPNGFVGKSYNHTLVAEGDTLIKWSKLNFPPHGNLPLGLYLLENGKIGGTIDNNAGAGTSYFTVKATNSASSDTKTLSITVLRKPNISTQSFPNGTLGLAYGMQLSATGSQPVTWSVESGELPNGLTLSEDGKVSGIPAKHGYFDFTVNATNGAGSDTRTFLLTIFGPPVILTTDLPKGTIGNFYYQVLALNELYPGPWTVWDMENGDLPNGLTFSSGSYNGVVLGTPTTAGTFNFTVKARNNLGSDTLSLSIVIEDGTGISENTLDNISIYPNPTNSILFVECNDYMQTTIKLFDMLGKEVLTENVNGKTEINISHLPQGIYNVVAVSEGRVIWESKIVKY
jgi:uncharacterized protein (TIGR02145 family)